MEKLKAISYEERLKYVEVLERALITVIAWKRSLRELFIV
jgi:hypothetical protein